MRSFRSSLLAIAAISTLGFAHAGGHQQPSQPANSPGYSSTNHNLAGAAAASQAAANSDASARASNTANNRATGGAASASTGALNVAPYQYSNPTQTQGVAVDARNQSTYQAQERDPVNSAYAPSLTASNGTCMGSTTAGATGPGASISFGTTWKDSDCSLRYTAEALRASGNNLIAQALLCQIAEVKKVAPKHCRAVETSLADPVVAMDEKVQEIVSKQTFVPLLP